ncbi:hypothetical protein FA10DRAFT_294132 [Acaromyces ingoldii]|uniref:Uncharacterized protein n=1 Tax=Acaromyces ingoldii TaxID=215250 RepID=A0A316YR51_9BASI|nr:hypothetical protein FA10DRAFT_294132 [Acaromyces ingoldii]PWN90513.1 hypothetical protein FA10DRAFT_294132 [Acaromyces ingoldii]
MLGSSRLAPYIILVFLAMSTFAISGMVAAEAETDPGGLTDRLSSPLPKKHSPLSQSSSVSFLNTAAETTRKRAGTKEWQRPFVITWFPHAERRAQRVSSSLGTRDSFLNDKLVKPLKYASQECRDKVQERSSSDLCQAYCHGDYRGLAITLLTCGVFPKNFVENVDELKDEVLPGEAEVKLGLAKKFIDAAHEEYRNEVFSPKNLDKLYDEDRELRGEPEMVEVTSWQDFLDKTKKKFSSPERQQVYRDQLKVIPVVYEGWKKLEKDNYQRFLKGLKDGTFTGNVADYFTRARNAQAPTTSRGRKRKIRVPKRRYSRLKTNEGKMFGEKRTEARLAQPLHDCGMGPLSKAALPGPKEEKERKAYFDEVAREWKEGQRNRYLFKWGILRPTMNSALSTGPSTNDPIPTGWSAPPSKEPDTPGRKTKTLVKCPSTFGHRDFVIFTLARSCKGPTAVAHTRILKQELSHSEGYDTAAPEKIMADKTGGFAKDYVQQALKEYEADAFSSESLEKRYAKYLEERGKPTMVEFKGLEELTIRENEKEEKESANVYLDVLAREWREAERNRWMLGQPKASSFVRTEEAKRGPITTTLKVNVSFLLGISQYAFLGWREKEGESYRRLLDDIREGRYNHNPFAYVKPEEYDHYHFLGQAKERGGRRGRKVPIIDLNKSPPEEKKGTKLSAFEEEYRRLRDNMKSTTSKERDVGSSGSTRWTPHFPSMVLSDPPYLGPRGLKPDIPKEILEKVAKPTSLLPFPETKTSDDSAKN